MHLYNSNSSLTRKALKNSSSIQPFVFNHLSKSPLSFQKSASFSSLSHFDLDIGITPVNIKEGHYRGILSDRWSIGDSPNGGYVMSMALNAAKTHLSSSNQVIPHPDPLSMTAYYVNKSIEFQPIDIHLRIIKQSKGTTNLHIQMKQENIIRSEYLAVFGKLPPPAPSPSSNNNSESHNNSNSEIGLTFSHKTPIQLPSRSQCILVNAPLRRYGNALKIYRELDVKVAPDNPFLKGFFEQKLGEKAFFEGWMKFSDAKKPCLTSMAFLNDSLPPILNIKPSNWIPTFQFTVHFWSHPPLPSSLSTSSTSNDGEEDYWVRTRFETLFSQNGMLHADGEIWSEDGKVLLSTSRQFARVMEPRK